MWHRVWLGGWLCVIIALGACTAGSIRPPQRAGGVDQGVPFLLERPLPDFYADGSALFRKGKLPVPTQLRLAHWKESSSLQLSILSPFTAAELLRLRINPQGWVLTDRSRKKVITHLDLQQAQQKKGQRSKHAAAATSADASAWLHALSTDELILLFTGRFSAAAFRALQGQINSQRATWQQRNADRAVHNTVIFSDGLPQQWRKVIAGAEVLKVIYADYRPTSRQLRIPHRITIYTKSRSTPVLQLGWRDFSEPQNLQPPQPFLSSTE